MSTANYNLSYYVPGLLSSQYKTSTNELAWLTANLSLFQDAFVCLNSFDAALDIGQAIGVQLDLLGTIIGISRTVNFQPSNSLSPVLDDTTYRLLLQATVLKNHWNGLTSELRVIWNALFPGGVMLISDQQDMSVDIYIAAPLNSLVQDLILNGYIIPRPQGVLYRISIALLPMLGFDRYDSFIAGFAAANTVYGVVNTSGGAVTRVAATPTGTTSGASTALTVSSGSNITIGQGVAGTNITAGTYVAAVSGTSVTLSVASSGSVSGTITFTYPGNPFSSGQVGSQILISGTLTTIATFVDANNITVSVSPGTLTGVFYFIGASGGHFSN